MKIFFELKTKSISMDSIGKVNDIYNNKTNSKIMIIHVKE